MSRKPTYQDARNFIKILRGLQDSYYGRMSYEEICGKLGISNRTLQRYVPVLKEEFVDLLETKELGGRRYLFFKRFELENRTGFQLAPLYLSRFFLSFLKGTPLDEALGEAVEIFEEGLDTTERKHLGSLGKKFWVVSVGPKLYDGKEELIDKLLRALLQQKRLQLTYHKPGCEEHAEYLFEPYTMLVYKQGLYLIGGTESHDHRFYLAVERIVNAALSGERFDYPKDFHPREFCEGCFGIFKDKEEEFTVRFSPEVAEYVRARRWHPSEVVEDRPDGGIELTMRVCGIQEVIPWILGFGEHAELVAPDHIRKEFKETISKMHRLYD